MRYVVMTELSFEAGTGKVVTHAPGAVVDEDAIPAASIPWLVEQGHIRPEMQAASAPDAAGPDAAGPDAPHTHTTPGGGRRRRTGEE